MQDMMYQLGRNLVKQNVIPFETLEQALKIKQSDPYTNQRTLAQVLIDEFEVDPDRIYTEMAQVNNVPALDLAQENLSDKRLQGMRKMFERLSPSMKELAKNEQILIFDYIAKPVPKFIFASVNPANPNISVLARALGTRRHEVRHLITANYVMLQDRIFAPTNEFLENLADTSLEIDDGEGEDGKQMDTSALESELNKSFLVNLAEGMLVEAVRRGASDIHVIPKDVTRTEIHFRLDGKLQPWYSEPGLRPEAFAAVLKDRSRNVDRFEREAAQDGFIQRSVDGHMIRYRVSIMPVVGKEVQFKLESVVIRVLDDRNVITDFNKLGLQHQSKSDFERAISKPQGMVILTGPTGSGKSTTLMAALSHIVKPEINVLTVEDPVEYLIPGVRQIKIGPKNDFEQALRSILRHDPDVVMVGEIRDKETAEIAIKLANTGHLTFSTLHTNDAPSAVSRLYKMGIETFLIANAINIIIAQRLIRKLCDRCKRPIQNFDPQLALSLGFTEKEITEHTFYEPVGCQHCNKGYKGRVAIHEAMYMSKEIKRIIFASGKDINEEAILNQAVKEGMLTLRASGRERVKTGVTSLEEVIAATAED